MNLCTSPAGITLIKQFEGFSAQAYRCQAGYLTIGYGHVVRAGESELITETQAEHFLIDDVRLAEAAVLRLIERPLAQHQFDALVSFTFNLGAGALQRSRLRRCVNRGDDRQAALEFHRWVFAGGKKLSGLVMRRANESRIYVGF